jgi:hypothetical protein
MECLHHEHLFDLLFSLRLPHCRWQMVHGGCTMNICTSLFSSMRFAAASCQQMGHGVFALMNI